METLFTSSALSGLTCIHVVTPHENRIIMFLTAYVVEQKMKNRDFSKYCVMPVGNIFIDLVVLGLIP